MMSASKQAPSPSDDALAERRAALATRAGFLVDWQDATDQPQRVPADVLAVLLARIGLPSDTVAQCEESLALLDAESLGRRAPPLLTGTVGEKLVLPEGWLRPGMTYSIALDGTIPPGAWDRASGRQPDPAAPNPDTRLSTHAPAPSGAAEIVGTTVGDDVSIPAQTHLRTLRGRIARCASPGDAMPADAPANAYVAIEPIDYPGYHTLQLFDDAQTRVALAIAPTRCFGVADALATQWPLDAPLLTARPADETETAGDAIAEDGGAGGVHVWGVCAQVYGLRPASRSTVSGTSHDTGAPDMGLGDFSTLADLARTAATSGAGALAISPLHAMCNADPGKYSPYSPSSRLFLNAWHIDPAAVVGAAACEDAIKALQLGPTLDALGRAPLIDWPTAVRARLAILRHLFDTYFAEDANAARPSSGSDVVGDTVRRAPADVTADTLAAAAERRAARAEFNAFRQAGGIALERHARFEALHAASIANADADDAAHGHDWRQWPDALRDPDSAEIAAFAETHRQDIDFQLFLQWQAAAGLARAQAAARAAGMPIGLIADLAVGCDSAGSQTWSDPDAMLNGLSVGAPPDVFNRDGQRWGLTTFSPRALTAQGFAPFIDMVRAALRHAGGLRVDHILGLRRLWLVPDGESAARGAYLCYPLEDLLRLLALESWRHRAIIIGEDLGTVPPGLRETLAEAGLLGMRVLWFEREENTACADGVAPEEMTAPFTPPSRWSRDAVAMTSTHDLPTLAGWWRGDDIGWRVLIEAAEARAIRTKDGHDASAHPGADGDQETGASHDEARSLTAILDDAKARKPEDMAARHRDRAALWAALHEAGVLDADDQAPATPARADELVPDTPPVRAMLRFVAAAGAPLTLFPLEDVLGQSEQPNLPGPSTVHPNWRRRMPRAIDETSFAMAPGTRADAAAGSTHISAPMTSPSSS